MKPVQTDHAPAAIGPYAQGIVLGGMLYTSGQIPLRPDGSMVEGGIAEQTEQVLSNLSAVLAAAGASLTDVVKTTIFTTDLGQFATLNEVYGKAFGAHRPARSTVGVAALPKGVLVEIEAIVALPQG